MKTSIFAKATTASPKPYPLAALRDALREFTPPPKPQALLDAEEAERETGARQVAATSAARECAAAIRAAEADKRLPRPPRSRLDELLAAETDAINAHGRAREAREAAALPWRHEYAKEIDAAVMPVRLALHDLIGELDASMALIADLAARAARTRVGSPWLARQADQILDLLRAVARLIEIDRKIAK